MRQKERRVNELNHVKCAPFGAPPERFYPYSPVRAPLERQTASGMIHKAEQLFGAQFNSLHHDYSSKLRSQTRGML